MNTDPEFVARLASTIEKKSRDEVNQLLLDTCLARNHFEEQFNSLVRDTRNCEENYNEACNTAIRFQLMSDPTIVDTTQTLYIDLLNKR